MFGKFFKNNTYVMHHGIAKGLKRRGGFGFLPKIKQKEEHVFLKNLRFQGKTIYDIGSFYGIFSLFFAQQAGSAGKVFAFEPNEDNYRCALENIKINTLDTVSLFPIALSQKTQKSGAFLFIPKHRSAMSFLGMQNRKNIYTDIIRQHAVVYALDDFVAERNIPLPDFIKIDVEGGELDVLRGMRNVLFRTHPDLCIEVHGEGDQKVIACQDILDFLRPYRYTVYSIEDKKNIEDAADFIGSHIFCTHAFDL